MLRTNLDDFTYDPQVAANSPPQLTGMGAGQLGSFKENGQLSIFANPAMGINAAIQDSDSDTVTVEVQQYLPSPSSTSRAGRVGVVTRRPQPDLTPAQATRRTARSTT